MQGSVARVSVCVCAVSVCGAPRCAPACSPLACAAVTVESHQCAEGVRAEPSESLAERRLWGLCSSRLRIPAGLCSAPAPAPTPAPAAGFCRTCHVQGGGESGRLKRPQSLSPAQSQVGGQWLPPGPPLSEALWGAARVPGEESMSVGWLLVPAPGTWASVCPSGRAPNPTRAIPSYTAGHPYGYDPHLQERTVTAPAPGPTRLSVQGNRR